MPTNFWRSTPLKPTDRETYAMHEAGHAVMAILRGCYTYIVIFDQADKEGTNAICGSLGSMTYEQDLDVTLAGPEVEYLVSSHRFGVDGDYEDANKLTRNRYRNMKKINMK